MARAERGEEGPPGLAGGEPEDRLRPDWEWRRTATTGRSGPPLYALIYDVLREHIVDGSFPPGLVLGEASVARAFQASRVPAAVALRQLKRDGLIRDFDGRGYVTGRGGAPVRLDLLAAGLRVPPALAGDLKVRNRRERIYPDVEHSVAVCLAYGRFLLNESALAEHYGVSRTVAHEVLTRLERTGLVTQDVNQRWYAGPLTAELLREHYEMRWLLEPIALGQASPMLAAEEIAAKLQRAEQASRDRQKPAELERLEHDLHVDIVLRCENRQLRETIRRSQLPIIATHSTFEHEQDPHEIETMVAEHVAILSALNAGRRADAMAALEAHLRRSLQPNIELLRKLAPLPQGRRPPYLVPVALPSSS
jgi:DNA-binding GntR family transcriptional regulator